MHAGRVVDLSETLGRIDALWSPKIVAQVGDSQVKLAKVHGTFDWHSHENEDELFLVLKGRLKLEFRNLPACRNTVRIFTLAGDLVQVLYHDGRGGSGTMPWNLLSRNGQEITSGIYLFSVEPADDRFSDAVGKFVVIR